MSLRFQADADLKHAIVRAVRQREPGIDFASAAEAGLEEVSDPELLDRAAAEGRIVVSHDRRTMPAHFRARIEARVSLGPVVSAIVLVWSASEPEEWRDQIHHLPSLARHVFR